VKIKVFHTLCGREILVQQILDTGGHCPWDGKPFNKDYTAVLAEALEAAENSGGVLENALEKIAGMEPDLTIDRESVLGDMQASIESLNKAGGGAAR
jgi:ABC-type Fe3+-hydroxamate transport system substrate-binding protein